MAIEVKQEEHHTEPHKRCCFCRAPTSFWVVNMDVACCAECASRAHPTDVPTKREWINRERIADHSIRNAGWQSKGRV